jgi:hypothetical protein
MVSVIFVHDETGTFPFGHGSAHIPIGSPMMPVIVAGETG